MGKSVEGYWEQIGEHTGTWENKEAMIESLVGTK
jgi:hypothetical protein